MIHHQSWFTSDKFRVLPGEEEETNPGCSGKDLARWLGTILKPRGYEVEIIPEDWGWCVMCARTPFMLWVGCSMAHPSSEPAQNAPCASPENGVWTCFVVAEVPWWKRLFPPQDTIPAANRLFATVHSALRDDARVVFVDQP